MKKWLIITTVLAVFSFGSLLAQDAQRMFVGVKKCRTCHKKPEAGEQYRIWTESKHSKAYETLAGEEAMKFAKERGIANPQEAPECLKCHVTGYGVDAKFFGPKYAKEDGVGCESCHGAGGDYYKKKIMKAIYAGETDPATVGLIKPDEKVCTSCHNEESPTYKPFKFEEFKEKIAHPIPEK